MSKLFVFFTSYIRVFPKGKIFDEEQRYSLGFMSKVDALNISVVFAQFFTTASVVMAQKTSLLIW